MHRLHLLRWFALVIAVFSFQCLDSLSDDCHTTRTCEAAPQLRADCLWHYPDGGVWAGGPVQLENGLWTWPDGKLTKTQKLDCRSADAGFLGDSGLEPGVDNCLDSENPCDPGLQCDTASNRCVKCLNDTDCADSSDLNRGATHFCDRRIHACVVCTQDSDCGPNLHCRTDADPNNNRCVECTKGSECSGEENSCDLTSNLCSPVCHGLDQCKPPKGICSNPEGGFCVGCLGNNDCSGATSQCNTSRKECVQCVDNTPCTNATAPICNPGNRCVECVDDTTCRNENKRHCDPVANGCVECLDSTQCAAPDKSRCNALHVCAPCTDSNQCESGAPICDTITGRCVACLDDGTCPSGLPLCDKPSGTCVGCLSNEACNQDPGAARCNLTSKRCEPCTPTSTECAGKFGVRDICSIGSLCVQCTQASDCAADPNKSRCDGNGLCAGCRTDNECGAVLDKHNCTGGNNGRCVECLNAQDCTGNPRGLACDTNTNTCVPCVLDTDCKTAGASRCVDNQCAPCITEGANTHCGHIVSGAKTLGVCDTSAGANAGVCVECTGAQRVACGAKACDSRTKICSNFDAGSAPSCGACVSDAHCAVSDRCVPETFNGTPLGSAFTSCFPVTPGTGGCPRPYGGTAPATTIDGVAVNVCALRVSTCKALNDSLIGLTCSADAECGQPGLDDGRCDLVAGACAAPCISSADCIASSTCQINAVCAI